MHYDEETQKPGKEVAIKKINLLGSGGFYTYFIIFNVLLDKIGDDEMDDLAKSIQSEINIFKKINENLGGNPYLVEVKGIYQTPHHVYVIMEFCS